MGAGAGASAGAGAGAGAGPPIRAFVSAIDYERALVSVALAEAAPAAAPAAVASVSE